MPLDMQSAQKIFHMFCGAKTRNNGTCKRSPLAGKTRCRLHGGASLSGKDHPNWKHGERSKEVIARSQVTRERIRELVYLGRLIGLFNE
jgi:glucans biosynthesis protein